MCFSAVICTLTGLFTSDEVPVYIDRMNEKTFFVDIDAVLPKVVVHR